MAGAIHWGDASDLEEHIARVAHTALGAFAEVLGEPEFPPWRSAPPWMRDSTLEGVRRRLAAPGAAPREQHELWVAERLDAGWRHGPVKDADQKRHPSLIDYDQLSEAERRKDALFAAIVDALNPESMV